MFMSKRAKLEPPGDLKVSIRFVEHPSIKPTSAIELSFAEYPGLETKWVRDQLVSLAHERSEYPTYDLSISEDHLSWGADASGAYVLIQLASDVGSAVVADLVLRCVFRLAKKARGRIEPLDRAAAVDYATGHIPIAFKERKKHLRVTGERENRPGVSWTISLVSEKSGDRYIVQVTRIKKRVVSVATERQIATSTVD